MMSGDLHGVGDSSRPTVGSLTAQRLGDLCLKSKQDPRRFSLKRTVAGYSLPAQPLQPSGTP